jgi:hypothetical protein
VPTRFDFATLLEITTVPAGTFRTVLEILIFKFVTLRIVGFAAESAMSLKSAILLSSVACAVTAMAQPVLPGYDLTKLSASFAGGMDFDDSGEELQISQFELRTALSKPINPIENFTILPVIQYKGTILDFRDSGSEDLHSISLSSFFVYNAKGSPWIYGAWARAELASDFEYSTGDAVTYDVVVGVAYEFSDTLTIGLGVAAINLNNDDEYFFGPAFDWKPSDCVRIGLYGPNAIASWTPDENWEISLRGDSSGDEWTVQNGLSASSHESATLDLDSYRIGLYADRRLTGDLWLRVGAGVTLANSLELETTSGDRIYHDDLGEGYFGEIALRLKVW